LQRTLRRRIILSGLYHYNVRLFDSMMENVAFVFAGSVAGTVWRGTELTRAFMHCHAEQNA
jgi:hypothetical protein